MFMSSLVIRPFRWDQWGRLSQNEGTIFYGTLDRWNPFWNYFVAAKCWNQNSWDCFSFQRQVWLILRPWMSFSFIFDLFIWRGWWNKLWTNLRFYQPFCCNPSCWSFSRSFLSIGSKFDWDLSGRCGTVFRGCWPAKVGRYQRIRVSFNCENQLRLKLRP